ncbi:AfsR/SARP family transcriptional regulator [Thermus oshimai]
MTSGRLRLLGGASLEVEGRPPLRLERRAAGVLAYLALEGPAPRSRMAGLLWPDSPERTARNNLAQTPDLTYMRLLE